MSTESARYPPLLTDYDLHLLAEGTHHRAYEVLGAHLVTVDGTPGVRFAVWAPNAGQVSVIGDFNRWDGLAHPMHLHPGGGVWELFIPGLAVGATYKYQVANSLLTAKADKSDPYGFHAELRPNNASVVADLDAYTWNDTEWIRARAARKPLAE